MTSSLCDDRGATEPRVPGKDELGLAHIVMAAWPGQHQARGEGPGEPLSGDTRQPRPARQLSRLSPVCGQSWSLQLARTPGHHRRVQLITPACNDNIMPMLAMADRDSGLFTKIKSFITTL